MIVTFNNNPSPSYSEPMLTHDHHPISLQKSNSILPTMTKQGILQKIEEEQIYQQIKKQFMAKFQSIKKGYITQQQKYRETYELKQAKYVQQIQYMNKRIKELQLKLTEKNEKQRVKDNCFLCSNGDVINHLHSIIERIETDHSGCLVQKTQLNARVGELEQKNLILSAELEQSENKNRKIKKQYMEAVKEIKSLMKEKKEQGNKIVQLLKDIDDKGIKISTMTQEMQKIQTQSQMREEKSRNQEMQTQKSVQSLQIQQSQSSICSSTRMKMSNLLNGIKSDFQYDGLKNSRKHSATKRMISNFFSASKNNLGRTVKNNKNAHFDNYGSSSHSRHQSLYHHKQRSASIFYDDKQAQNIRMKVMKESDQNKKMEICKDLKNVQINTPIFHTFRPNDKENCTKMDNVYTHQTIKLT